MGTELAIFGLFMAVFQIIVLLCIDGLYGKKKAGGKAEDEPSK